MIWRDMDEWMDIIHDHRFHSKAENEIEGKNGKLRKCSTAHSPAHEHDDNDRARDHVDDDDGGGGGEW